MRTRRSTSRKISSDTDDGILYGGCLEWLERTVNAKVHGTTKLILAEVFQEEREYLRPLLLCDQVKRPVICWTVRKDNPIIYDSNRYSAPFGTYTKRPTMRIETLDGILYIRTLFGEPICEHRISSGRGMLIQSQSHRRDRTTALDKLMDQYGMKAAFQAQQRQHHAGLSGVPDCPVQRHTAHLACSRNSGG